LSKFLPSNTEQEVSEREKKILVQRRVWERERKHIEKQIEFKERETRSSCTKMKRRKEHHSCESTRSHSGSCCTHLKKRITRPTGDVSWDSLRQLGVQPVEIFYTEAVGFLHQAILSTSTETHQRERERECVCMSKKMEHYLRRASSQQNASEWSQKQTNKSTKQQQQKTEKTKKATMKHAIHHQKHTIKECKRSDESKTSPDCSSALDAARSSRCAVCSAASRCESPSFPASLWTALASGSSSGSAGPESCAADPSTTTASSSTQESPGSPTHTLSALPVRVGELPTGEDDTAERSTATTSSEDAPRCATDAVFDGRVRVEVGLGVGVGVRGGGVGVEDDKEATCEQDKEDAEEDKEEEAGDTAEDAEEEEADESTVSSESRSNTGSSPHRRELRRANGLLDCAGVLA
jgi:DNA polymerase III alpha subunit (gram-positive type)